MAVENTFLQNLTALTKITCVILAIIYMPHAFSVFVVVYVIIKIGRASYRAIRAFKLSQHSDS